MTTEPAPSGSAATLREGIAEEVRALLARRRMSGVQLAKRIGKSHTYVSRRLTGETAFDADDLEQIAHALDAQPTDLLPKPVTRQFRKSLGIGERVVAVGGADRPSRTAQTGKAVARRSHRPGRAVSQTRPLSPALQ